MDLLLRAQALFPVLKALKDDLHRHPELSGREVRTTALLKQKLSALPVELVDLGVPTGTAADGIRQLAAVAAVVGLHLRFRNTLLSVGAGTALYMALLRL